MTITLPPTLSRPRAAALLLLLSALSLGAALAGPAVAADDGARWTVKPADNRFGAGRQDYGYTLSPGGRLRDDVVVANQGAATLHLALRATGSDRVASWVRFSRDAVTVAPGASVTVPFTLAPPRGAAAGDHVGGIAAVPAGTAAAAGSRPGLPIRLRVSGPLKPALSVEAVRVRYAGTGGPLGTGDATVTYTIHNTGNATLGARPAVSASGPLGTWSRHAGRIADTPPLPPGGTWTGSASLSGVAPALRVGATVRVVPLLIDASGSIAPLPAVQASGHALAVPWTPLIVLLVGLGLAGVALRRVRAPRRVDGAVA
jgi:hypothetical protein